MNRYIALQKVIALGGFTKAAEELGYTQSAVSQMIASLEKELGIKLLLRSRHEVSLTQEGKALFPYIESAIYQYRAIHEKANEIKGLGTGMIRIGTIASISYQWLPDLVKDFQTMYPNVEFTFYQGDYSSIEEWIHTGAVDFGFVTPPAVNGLQTEVLAQGEMLAVLPLDSPLLEKPRIPITDVCQQPFILLEEGKYNEVLLAFEKHGLSPNIKFTIHDDFTIMRMIEKGLGISILSELMTEQAPYRIQTRPIEPPIYRTIAVGYKAKERLSVASRRFMDFIYDRITV